MTRPASPPSRTATSNAAAPKASCATSKARLLQEPLKGHTGIGHTRWATHGRPTERNAHPHMNGQVSVVHNGIIENFRELKAELGAKGYVFESDTDTEAIVHVVTDELAQGPRSGGGRAPRARHACRAPSRSPSSLPATTT